MADEGAAVTVVGSIHMDLIAVADRLPHRGEALTGRTFGMHPGGKGGNQAAQVALSGASAWIVSRLGNDSFGRQLRAALAAKGVDTTFVATDDEYPTGASPLLIGADGEYASIIVPGAAARLSTVDVDAARPALERSRVLMLQLELPFDISAYAAATARALGTIVVLNASPAPGDPAAIPRRLWDQVDLLVVNGLEAQQLSGVPATDIETARRAADALRDRFRLAAVVLTLGAAGVLLATTSGFRYQPAWPVAVVDTVGAGDAFAGALVAEIARGRPIEEALPFASAAGALAVTRAGAYDALPTRAEIDTFIARRSSPDLG